MTTEERIENALKVFDIERARPTREPDRARAACLVALRGLAGSMPERVTMCQTRARKGPGQIGFSPINSTEMVEAAIAEACKRRCVQVKDFKVPGNRLVRAWAWTAAHVYLSQTVIGAVHGYAQATVGNTCRDLIDEEAAEAREWALANLKPVLAGSVGA